MEGNILKCKTHSKELGVICLNEKCASNKLICMLCLEDDHEDHKWISLAKVKKRVKEHYSSLPQDSFQFDKDLISKFDGQATNHSNKVSQLFNTVSDKLMAKVDKVETELRTMINKFSMEVKDRITLLSSDQTVIDKLESTSNSTETSERLIEELFLEYNNILADPNREPNAEMQEFIENKVGILEQAELTIQDASELIIEALQGISLDPNACSSLKGGIFENYNYDHLIRMGFKVVYDKDYSHRSTNEEIEEIAAKIKPNSMICVGSTEKSNPSVLTLCAIDKAELVLKKTNDVDKASKGKFDAFWYWHKEKSFGFAECETVKLACADHHEKSRVKRLSWCVHGSCAGSRLGSQTGYTNSKSTKLILIR